MKEPLRTSVERLPASEGDRVKSPSISRPIPPCNAVHEATFTLGRASSQPTRLLLHPAGTSPTPRLAFDEIANLKVCDVDAVKRARRTEGAIRRRARLGKGAQRLSSEREECEELE